MTEFDPQLWKERAWARFCRASKAIRPKDKERLAVAEREWFTDVVAISDIGLIVDWCGVRCIKVNFVKKPFGTYHSAEKEISISSRLRPLKQAVVLLHECGHHLVEGADRAERFLMGYPQNKPEVTRTFHHRLTCLEEEMEAWHRGWKLSRRLELSVSREQFDGIRLECLRTYVKWTLHPGSAAKD